MTASTHLNPTDGHVIAGTLVNDRAFIGRMRAAQLFQLAPDPRDAENPKKREDSRELQEVQHIRDEVQRHFEGAKKANVKPYAAYIIDLSEGAAGITPPITLYCERELQYEDRQDGTAMLQVPWDVKLVAIDGETQLAARYEAQNVSPDTAQEFLPVYICFGRSQPWARQAFHDLNTLAVRPNTALSMSMDARDPVTRLAAAVEREVPMLQGKVNKSRRQLRGNDPEIVTITGLRGALSTLTKGIAGTKYGSRPIEIMSDELPRVEAAAVDWMNAVFEALGPQIIDRAGSIAGANAVLASIGAIGHPLTMIEDDHTRKVEAYKLATGLRVVHWERGKRWDGIAGKMTPKGLTIAGTKEAAHAIYAALTDKARPEFSTVRAAA